MKKFAIVCAAVFACAKVNAGYLSGFPSFHDYGNGTAVLTCYGSTGICATTYAPLYQGGPTLLTTSAAPGRIFEVSVLASDVPDPNPNPPRVKPTSQVGLTEQQDISPAELVRD